MADDNSSTSFDNSDSETGLPDLSTLKPSDVELKKKISDKNYTPYNVNPRTFRANRGLLITAGINMVGFVSQWKWRKKVCVA